MKFLKQSFTLIIVLVLTLIFVGCNNTNKNYNLKNLSNAYITLDINPSIEIITNEEGLVAQVNGLNDDGIKLLVDTDFTNQSVEFVVEEILELAIEFGYIDFNLENAILITTSAETEEETEELEVNLSKKVQDFIDARKIKMDILKASLEASGDIKELAAEYEISIGKVKMITHAMAVDSDLSFEVAAMMHVRDLNKIIKEGRQEVREFYSEEIRSLYQKSKEELKLEFKLAVKGLINDAIQEADAEVFIELTIDSEVSVEEVKALYQKYLEALLTAEVPVQEENDDDEEEDQDNMHLYQELKKEYARLLKDLRGIRFSEEENIEELLEQIKEVALEIKELEFEIRFSNRGKGHMGNMIKPKDDLYDDLEDEYEDLFEELGIELEDLEEYFEDLLEEEIEKLILEFRDELSKVHEVFMQDSIALKLQIKEEREILRKIWK